jgi:hypothetical protein
MPLGTKFPSITIEHGPPHMDGEQLDAMVQMVTLYMPFDATKGLGGLA